MAADKKSAQQLIEVHKQLNSLIQNDLDNTNKLFNTAKHRALKEEEIANNQRLINELKSKDVELSNTELQKLNELESNQRKLTSELQKQNNVLEKRKTIQGIIISQIKTGWGYLMESDKVIKSTVLSLGLSSAKADAMRASFEQSAGYVARLGGGIADIGSIMTGYADETGRARAMTASMIEDITAIGYGTGLGIEQATKLGAQFEFMGFDARTTMEYVQGVVDTSERMGVNTTKVLKNVNDNFKKLSTFTFQKGVKGFAEMAMSAEKTKVSMEMALDIAEATRGLEQVIELGANLQIMGGEFAKMDPFEWLYIARNEPEKLTQKLSEMTTGLYTFRKMADGTFEKFISPADVDRLSSVAKSLGKSKEEMFVIAQRRLDLNEITKEMMGLGLTSEQKEIIQGAAFFNKNSGKFQVELAGTMRDVGSLTKTQAEAFKVEQVSLQKRAEEAMTFERAFKATIEELKSALLPILKSINVALSWLRETTRPFVDMLQGGERPWLRVATAFMAAGLLWKGLLKPLAGRIGAATVGRVGGAIRGTRGVASAIPAAGKGSSGLALQRAGVGAGAAGKGAGISKAGTGVAAAGIGVGIMLAAKGIGELAEKMKELDGTQIWALPATVAALSISFFALAPAITAAGAAGTVGSVGILAIGAAFVGIGFGINLATKGIGAMAEGLGTMFDRAKGAGPDMLMIAGAIAATAGALALFSNPLSALGLIAFAGVMGTIAIASVAASHVAGSFEKMGIAMKGSKDDWIAIENAVQSISKANFKGGGALTELANLLKNPLKVEFANKDVAIVSNITMEIDGDKFMQKVYRANTAVQKQVEAKSGQGSGN